MGELQSRVPAEAAGRPLVEWLAARFTYLDAAGWTREVAAGRVRRNGARAAPDDVLAAGDEVAYAPPAAAAPPPAVTVVHEDADCVVVDKPPHLVCHRRGAFAHNTFLPALEARLGRPLEPVHRLDRETSGLLLLSRGPAATAALQRQFEAGAVEKRYLAVVHGRVRDQAFAVDAAIGRATGAVRDRRVVAADGGRGARPACTEVAVVARHLAHTLVAAVPRTGRTHQIRVHLAHAGHPIVGDKLYGATDADYLAWVRHLKSGGDPRARERLMLHAAELAFTQPTTGARVALRAEPPPDMRALLDRLAAASAL